MVLNIKGVHSPRREPSWVLKAMKKKVLLPLLLSSLFMLASCGEETIVGSNETHDSSAWFTNEELKAVGLEGLAAPTGLTGDMSSDLHWFNNGYSFHQTCPSKEIMKQNAQTYLDYFKTNYEGQFGITHLHALSEDTTWYYILPKTDLEDYHDTNPSSLYKFYYVRDAELENGYLKDGAVWSLDMRYELNTDATSYLLKIFIEDAGMSRNGVYTLKYTLKV